MLPRSVAVESWARCWRGVLKWWSGRGEESKDRGEMEELFLTPQSLPMPLLPTQDFGVRNRGWKGGLTCTSRKDWWGWADDLV